MQVAYLMSAETALASLRMAIEEASASLPDDIKKQKWMAAKHSPSPWRMVEAWYCSHEHYEESIGHILTHLVQLSEALSHVYAVVQPWPEGEGTNLPKLAKMRRQQ